MMENEWKYKKNFHFVSVFVPAPKPLWCVVCAPCHCGVVCALCHCGVMCALCHCGVVCAPCHCGVVCALCHCGVVCAPCHCGAVCDLICMYPAQMETEMIDKLDVFISGGMGDAKYRQQLYIMYVYACMQQ